MAKQVAQDVPQRAPLVIKQESFRQFVGRKIAGDQISTTGTEANVANFPWTYAQAFRRPIGTMFASTITDNMLADMYRRYQLAGRIIDAPVEESFYQGFELFTDPTWPEEQQRELIQRAMWLYNLHKFKIIRFSKLVRLFGHSELIFGWNDPRNEWNIPVRQQMAKYKNMSWSWTQPVPKPNETELKESLTIPVRIEQLTVNFGAEALVLDPSRFLHAMNPKLIEEDKQGQSVLLPVANLLEIQIHMDWSTGQAFWRNASGLLALIAGRKNVDNTQANAAIASVENHNSKTVVHVPFGWNIKNVLKGSGNLAIARTYKIILEQIAAGVGIPVSVLIGNSRNSLGIPDEDKLIYYRTVGVVQENLLTPTLQKFFRNGQMAGLIPPGPIGIRWNPPEYQSPVEKATEEMQLMAIQNLMVRMSNPEICEIEGKDLVKLVTGNKKARR